MDIVDISTAFKWNKLDAHIGEQLILRAETPEAIAYLAKHQSELTDAGYWFFLSTLWVSYTGFSDLNLWRKMFSTNRPNKEISLMKPSELKALKSLPNKLRVYRAVRDGETDCISYTLSLETAQKMARQRESNEIIVGVVKKHRATALFLRRGEDEVIVLNKNDVKITSHLSCSSESYQS